jgi:hypothetical protein
MYMYMYILIILCDRSINYMTIFYLKLFIGVSIACVLVSECGGSALSDYGSWCERRLVSSWTAYDNYDVRESREERAVGQRGFVV